MGAVVKRTQMTQMKRDARRWIHRLAPISADFLCRGKACLALPPSVPSVAPCRCVSLNAEPPRIRVMARPRQGPKPSSSQWAKGARLSRLPAGGLLRALGVAALRPYKALAMTW